MAKSRFRMSFAAVAAVAIATLAVVGAQSASSAAPHQNVTPSPVAGAQTAMAPQTFATKAEADAATKANLRANGRQAKVAAAPGQCTGTWVWLKDTVGVFNHASPDPNDIKYWAAGGQYSPCRKLVIGDRYNGCGYTGANGYILIPDIRQGVFHPKLAGLIISTCTED